MRLKDKVAIVTGSSTGIGKAIAIAFAREGAKVVLAGRSLPKMEDVVKEIKSSGGIAAAIKTDITEEKQIKDMVDKAVAQYGRVDILVNNSASTSDRELSVAEMDLDMWNMTIRVNLTGTMLCCREVLRSMLPRKSGNIINISSIAGTMGHAKRSAYGSSKWAVIGFTETLSEEVGPDGIRVNCISPAGTLTDRFKEVTEGRGMTVEERIKQTAFQYSLRRMANTSEVAAAAVFLASDESSAITGQNLPVTCGFHMPSPGEQASNKY
jgi:NAD(P)-dependent dehydrogenase (short-subunit alcohol dehydrogenase family)